MSLLTDPTITKIVGGAVLSAFLTVGGLSYSNKNTNDTQDVRLAQLEKSQELIADLTKELALTNTNIAVLNARLEALKEKLDEQKSN